MILLPFSNSWSIRFEKVRIQADDRIHLALHGTNGFEPELIKRCIAVRVTKINVNRLVLDGYYNHLRENAGKMPHTQLTEEGIQKLLIRLSDGWISAGPWIKHDEVEHAHSGRGVCILILSCKGNQYSSIGQNLGMLFVRYQVFPPCETSPRKFKSSSMYAIPFHHCNLLYIPPSASRPVALT